jgi:hypothetical protein
MNISRGAYKLKVKNILQGRLREYTVAIVWFSRVCKQWGGRKNLKYPKGVMSCFSQCV